VVSCCKVKVMSDNLNLTDMNNHNLSSLEKGDHHIVRIFYSVLQITHTNQVRSGASIIYHN
jgi:ABC-type cobalamin transport system ATPase subunit